MNNKFLGEIKGIYFNNGIQGIARIIEEDEHFMYVEDLLGLQLQQNPDGNPVVSLEDFTPFAVIEDKGLETRIPQSSIMLLFPVQEQLLAGYKKRVGPQIEIVSGHHADALRTK